MNRMKPIGEKVEGYEFDNLMSDKLELDMRVFQKDIYIKRLEQDREILTMIVKVLANKLPKSGNRKKI